MNRSITDLVRLYSDDCLPTLRLERKRSRTISKSGSCWDCCLRDSTSSLKRRFPPLVLPPIAQFAAAAASFLEIGRVDRLFG